MITALKRHIVESGEHQYAVAQRAGMTETRFSRIACGRADATEDEEKRIGAALGISTQRLFPKSVKR